VRRLPDRRLPRQRAARRHGGVAAHRRHPGDGARSRGRQGAVHRRGRVAAALDAGRGRPAGRRAAVRAAPAELGRRPAPHHGAARRSGRAVRGLLLQSGARPVLGRQAAQAELHPQLRHAGLLPGRQVLPRAEVRRRLSGQRRGLYREHAGRVGGDAGQRRAARPAHPRDAPRARGRRPDPDHPPALFARALGRVQARHALLPRDDGPRLLHHAHRPRRQRHAGLAHGRALHLRPVSRQQRIAVRDRAAGSAADPAVRLLRLAHLRDTHGARVADRLRRQRSLHVRHRLGRLDAAQRLDGGAGPGRVRAQGAALVPGRRAAGLRRPHPRVPGGRGHGPAGAAGLVVLRRAARRGTVGRRCARCWTSTRGRCAR